MGSPTVCGNDGPNGKQAAYPIASHQMNNTDRVTIASIGATIGLGLWLSLALSAQTRDLMARCKQGPDPAACELRLMGR
jgi:hypothetical protein